MATEKANPLLMPCPNVPKKRLLDELNISRRSLSILGLILILLIASIPRGLTPFPDPPVPSSGTTNGLVSTGEVVPDLLKKDTISKENVAELIQTTDGGFALAINTKFSATEDQDTLLVKTDMNGTVQWSQTYEGNSYTEVGALVQTIDGGYALVGRTYEGDKMLLWIVKTDPGGKVEWKKTFSGDELFYASLQGISAFIQTKDGDFVLVLAAYPTHDSGIPDSLLVKFNSYGKMEWSKSCKVAIDHLGITDLIQTKDGGFALVGNTPAWPIQSTWLVKTDSNGIEEWNKHYGENNYDQLSSLVQTEDGGFALAGDTSPPYGGSNQDMLLIKTNNKGVIEWSKTYGGGYYDHCNTMVQTTDGGFTLAGFTESWRDGWKDTWLVKTDDIGVMEWNKTYEGSEDDEAVTVFQTVDSGFVIAGVTNTYYSFYDEWRLTEHVDADTWLMKTDVKGGEEWKRIFDGTFDEEWATDLIQTADGDFVFTGSVGSQNLGRNDAWLVKTDENGLQIWNQTYGGIEEDYPETIIETGDGGFVIAGSTFSQTAGKSDAWLIKTDENGLLIWNQTYGGSKDDGIEAVIQTNDGGFALAGFTRSFGAGNSDAWLIKTDRNGVVEWNQTFGGNMDDKAQNILQLVNGSFVLSGYIGQFVNASYHSGFACWHWETFDQAWLMITDENGVLHQNFTYEQPGSLRFHDIMNADDTIIIAGLTTIQMDPSDWMSSIGQNSLFYLRLDETGFHQWNKTLTNEFSAGDLIFTTDGFLLTGYVEVDEGINYRSVVKIDSTGMVQWTLEYGIEMINLGTALIQTADGGYALVAGAQSHGTCGDSADVWLSRINGNGTVLWEKVYGITGGITNDGWKWYLDSGTFATFSFTSWYLVVAILIAVTSFKSDKRNLRHERKPKK
jgi:hypothetical protein